MANTWGVPSELGGSSSTRKTDPALHGKVKELKREVDRLELGTNALWEVIRERLNLTVADLEAKMGEIDLRDGIEDGRITEIPLKCPSCGRVSSSKHWRCLYCGQDFEKETLG